MKGLDDRTTRWIGATVLALTAAWFMCSRLVFTPVPWPDGSAFYLPTLDLFQWPPRWQMHAQAAFVPSYDEANFNTMPGLPLYFGLGCRLGLSSVLGSVFAIRLLSLFPFLLWAWVIWRWLMRSRVTPWLAAAVGLSALWDPTVRWGTLVVRPEMWVGAFWALTLVEAAALEGGVRASEGRGLWRVGLWLALAAYCHFEAAYLVPATVLTLAGTAPLDLKRWWQRLRGVAWRTLVFLSPWLTYVLLHIRLFFSQLEIQFHRLDAVNRHVANAYLFFHSLFLWLGTPVGTPKFFNLAKAIFWALAMALTLRALVLTRRPAGFVRLGACVAWWTGLYLWWSKPEVWFITMCHVTLWPWVALELVLQTRAPPSGEPRWRTFPWLWRWPWPWAIATTAVLSFLATLGQMLQIPPYYTRANYRAWVDCIEKQTELARMGRSGIPPGARGPIRIWQPHVPDVLIELSDRHADYDLTRALDFEARRSFALDFGRKAEVLIFSRFFNLSRVDERVTLGADSSAPVYEGAERPQDLKLLIQNDYESPFGPWAASELEAAEPGARVRTVCQVGPFWAEVFRKK